MPAFRRVEAAHASPAALGILVPPGRRTFVILRPRALPWDLLLCRGGDDLAFRDLAHDEARAAAMGLYHALCDAPPRGEAVPSDMGMSLRITVGPFTLTACPRRPGQPYAALVCPPADAVHVLAQLAAALAGGEVYFNVRHFEPLPR